MTTAGAVIDAKDINGTVTIAAPNVTIKRSRFTGTGQDYAMYVRSGNVTVQDSEISGGYYTAGIAFDNWTGVRAQRPQPPDDGFKLGSNTLLQDSWIHDFTPEAGAHADGVQMQNGVTNGTIVHNTIDITRQLRHSSSPPTSAPPPTARSRSSDNILGGGNYTLYVVDGNNGQYYVQNITVSATGSYGTTATAPPGINVTVAWSIQLLARQRGRRQHVGRRRPTGRCRRRPSTSPAMRSHVKWSATALRRAQHSR